MRAKLASPSSDREHRDAHSKGQNATVNAHVEVALTIG